MTANDGSYSFTGLTSGKYEITETHPATMFDGIDVAGTQGGTVTNDKISRIMLDPARRRNRQQLRRTRPAAAVRHEAAVPRA